MDTFQILLFCVGSTLIFWRASIGDPLFLEQQEGRTSIHNECFLYLICYKSSQMKHLLPFPNEQIEPTKKVKIERIIK